MDVSNLLHIADNLDFLGLQKEADIVDRLIERHAALLSFVEKPILGQLAKIVLVLSKFKPKETIRGVDITFPITKRPLVGMTRQEAVKALKEYFKATIDKVLIPSFEKYKGTQHESKYVTFVELAQDVYLSLDSLLPVRTEQQSIRDVTTAIDQVKRALGKLMVYMKVKEERGEKFNLESEKMIRQGVGILNDMQSNVRVFDEESIEGDIKKLKELFPRDLSPQSSFYSLVCTAYREKGLEFIGEKEVNERAIDRMELSVSLDLEKADTQLKMLAAERTKKLILFEQVEDLEIRFNEIVQLIHQSDLTQPTQSLTIQEYDVLLKDVYVQPRIYDYRNRYRKYDQISGDVTILERWLNNYIKDSDVNQKIPFTLYLSKGRSPKALESAINIIERNVLDLKSEVEHDLDLIDRGADKAQRVLLQHVTYKREVINDVIWEEWYDNFISRLIQTLRYSLSPEAKGSESTTQTFNRVLRGFQRLLEYEM